MNRGITLSLIIGFILTSSIVFAGPTTLVSGKTARNPSNGDSVNPSISGNGRVVAFESTSDNLIRRDRNGVLDVFTHVLPQP